MSPQQQYVADYVSEHGEVSFLEAVTELGVGRLSERIRELEAMGWKFHHDLLPVQNRLGLTVRVGRYRLVERPVSKLPTG